jgi:hypothetical protein
MIDGPLDGTPTHARPCRLHGDLERADDPVVDGSQYEGPARRHVPSLSPGRARWDLMPAAYRE